MTANGWFQILFFLAVIFAITKPLGVFIARVFNREKTFLDFALRPIERLIYRACGIHEDREMRWLEYGTAMLLFSASSMILLYLIERTQHFLAFNPQKLANVGPDLAWNTAASFTTNTNWQSYVPETTMSYLTQMAGLAYHNFASAAVGIALAIAFIRGIARRESKTIGNFWVDLTRSFLWVLLPISFVAGLVLVSQGVVQNLKPYATAQLVEPQTIQTQTPDGKTTTQTVTQQPIALGPVASQEAIKMFGTNGGGFFNTNSAHPFENPTPFTNFLQMVLIFAIPSALTYTLGRMTGVSATAGPSGRPWLFSFWLGSRLRMPPNPAATRNSGRSINRRAPCKPAETWKARKFASASPIPHSSRRSPPTRAAAPSIPCTIHSRRSAA